MKRRTWISGLSLSACSAWLPLAPLPAGASETLFRPLYPLGMVVFPGERVSLQVFEPRYRQLMTDCAAEGTNFGIVTVVRGGVSNFGTEMMVTRVGGTDVGEALKIEAQGLRIFELHSIQRDIEGKPYPGAMVVFHRNDPRIEPEIQGALAQLFNRAQYLSGSRRELVPPYPDNLSFIIGHDVGLSRSQELRLIAMAAERDRQAFLFQHLLRSG